MKKKPSDFCNKPYYSVRVREAIVPQVVVEIMFAIKKVDF